LIKITLFSKVFTISTNKPANDYWIVSSKIEQDKAVFKKIAWPASDLHA
jgi:hypothetical protein